MPGLFGGLFELAAKAAFEKKKYKNQNYGLTDVTPEGDYYNVKSGKLLSGDELNENSLYTDAEPSWFQRQFNPEARKLISDREAWNDAEANALHNFNIQQGLAGENAEMMRPVLEEQGLDTTGKSGKQLSQLFGDNFKIPTISEFVPQFLAGKAGANTDKGNALINAAKTALLSSEGGLAVQPTLNKIETARAGNELERQSVLEPARNKFNIGAVTGDIDRQPLAEQFKDLTLKNNLSQAGVNATDLDTLAAVADARNKQKALLSNTEQLTNVNANAQQGFGGVPLHMVPQYNTLTRTTPENSSIGENPYYNPESIALQKAQTKAMLEGVQGGTQKVAGYNVKKQPQSKTLTYTPLIGSNLGEPVVNNTTPIIAEPQPPRQPLIADIPDERSLAERFATGIENTTDKTLGVTAETLRKLGKLYDLLSTTQSTPDLRYLQDLNKK